MATPKTFNRVLRVEHITILSDKTFDAVRAALESLVPVLDTDLIPELTSGDRAAIEAREKSGPSLYRFLERDHGAILAIAGRRRNAIQYEIGNPITASKMTRHSLGASLYAPLRITLFELDDESCAFEYDLPSSLFGQFGDERVRDVGLHLDRELESVLIKAAT